MSLAAAQAAVDRLTTEYAALKAASRAHPSDPGAEMGARAGAQALTEAREVLRLERLYAPTALPPGSATISPDAIEGSAGVQPES